jgi:hypothetical protein
VFRGITFPLGLYCPNLAPKRKHILTILGPPFSSAGAFHGKTEFGLLLEDAKENIPNFERDAKSLIMRSFRKDWPGFRFLIIPPYRS